MLRDDKRLNPRFGPLKSGIFFLAMAGSASSTEAAGLQARTNATIRSGIAISTKDSGTGEVRIAGGQTYLPMRVIVRECGPGKGPACIIRLIELQ
jgi:hypothetical protein